MSPMLPEEDVIQRQLRTDYYTFLCVFFFSFFEALISFCSRSELHGSGFRKNGRSRPSLSDGGECGFTFCCILCRSRVSILC